MSNLSISGFSEKFKLKHIEVAFEYEKLIDEIWNVDKGELVININNSLIELNEKHNNDFRYEKEDYIRDYQAFLDFRKED